MHKSFTLAVGKNCLQLGPKPIVMGILNATPDSFSDGGDHNAVEKATAQALRMVDEGAEIIDIGGESTRPGAEPVSAQQELDRVMPLLDALGETGIQRPFSIDTYKAVVGHQALQAGASIINDVRGFQFDPELADVAAHYNTPCILAHWDPNRDQSADIVSELIRYFEKSLQICENARLSTTQIVLDPGFGFAKTYTENFEILRRIEEIGKLGYPLLAGFSRKSTLGKLSGKPPNQRDNATAVTSVLAYMKGAHIFRVHNVEKNVEALQIARAALYGPPLPKKIQDGTHAAH